MVESSQPQSGPASANLPGSPGPFLDPVQLFAGLLIVGWLAYAASVVVLLCR